jgi:hypothetical protein
MRAYVGPLAIERIRNHLTERDLGIVYTLGQHRYLSSTQIAALHFAGHETEDAGARVCRRVLARLNRLGIVSRLERRIGGVRAGSAAYVYELGAVGGRLLGDVRHRLHEPSKIFLDHMLAVGDVHVALVKAERRGEIELIEIEIEHASWRRFIGPGGASEKLRPDLYVVTASGDFEHCWFIEVDLASESLTTIVRKCRQYAAYRQTGIEQHRSGTFPIVVWSVPSAKRQEQITRAIAAAKRLPEELFRVVEAGGLVGLLAGGSA